MKLAANAWWSVVPALAFALPGYAQDENAVRGMAATCANCHTVQSREAGGIPPIVANDGNTLLQQLKDFKSGARPATVMHQLARGFTDAQLEQLAAYFARTSRGDTRR